MCTVPDALPDSICFAIDRAWLIGIVKPCAVPPVPESAELPEPPKPLPPNPPNWNPDDAAVSTPLTWPWELTSGPPESPAWMSALDWISPDSCSEVPEPSSEAVIDWSSAVTATDATDGVPSTPPALPRPTTV